MTNYLVCLLLISISLSCRSQKDFPENHYRLVKGIKADAETEEKYENAWRKSNSYLLLDEETGDFKGAIESYSFSGKYDFGRTSSGFVKGFKINVDLGYMQFAEMPSNQLEIKRSLAQASSLIFFSDQLVQPNWDFMEVRTQEGTLLTFLRKKKP